MAVGTTPRGLVTATTTIKHWQKSPYTGVFLKAIHLDEAKPRGLRAAFAAPADEDDKRTHLENELRLRLEAFDKFFGLSAKSQDIWQERAKALLSRHFEMDSNDPQWWRALAARLLREYVPGFSIKSPGARKHGAPQEWDFWQMAQLFADIEYLKRKAHWSVRKVCNELPKTKGYKQRWRRYKPDRLRKAYLQAKKLQKDQFEFQLILSGGEWLIPASGIDPIDAAIERHALKV
jgi:hypothetical protein